MNIDFGLDHHEEKISAAYFSHVKSNEKFSPAPKQSPNSKLFLKLTRMFSHQVKIKYEAKCLNSLCQIFQVSYIVMISRLKIKKKFLVACCARLICDKKLRR